MRARLQGDLSGHEVLAAPRGLVVEKDAVGGVHPVALTVVADDAVGVELGRSVRRARVEGRGLTLRDLLDLAVELGGRRLVEPRIDPGASHGLEQAQHTGPGNVGGILRLLERDADVGLCREVIDLVRPDRRDGAVEAARVAEITVVQLEALGANFVPQCLDAPAVEARSPARQAVHQVALVQQKFSQVRTILPGDAGYERALRHGVNTLFGPSWVDDRLPCCRHSVPRASHLR